MESSSYQAKQAIVLSAAKVILGIIYNVPLCKSQLFSTVFSPPFSDYVPVLIIRFCSIVTCFERPECM